jgi:hypothetical protein
MHIMHVSLVVLTCAVVDEDALPSVGGVGGSSEDMAGLSAQSAAHLRRGSAGLASNRSFDKLLARAPSLGSLIARGASVGASDLPVPSGKAATTTAAAVAGGANDREHAAQGRLGASAPSQQLLVPAGAAHSRMGGDMHVVMHEPELAAAALAFVDRRSTTTLASQSASVFAAAGVGAAGGGRPPLVQERGLAAVSRSLARASLPPAVAAMIDEEQQQQQRTAVEGDHVERVGGLYATQQDHLNQRAAAHASSRLGLEAVDGQSAQASHKEEEQQQQVRRLAPPRLDVPSVAVSSRSPGRQPSTGGGFRLRRPRRYPSVTEQAAAAHKRRSRQQAADAARDALVDGGDAAVLQWVARQTSSVSSATDSDSHQ